MSSQTRHASPIPKAANDNTPQQHTPTKTVCHDGVWIGSHEIELFIEYDLKFGRPQPEYPTCEDTLLPEGGVLIPFLDANRHRFWVAAIPEVIGSGFAYEWRIEIYKKKIEAATALRRSIEQAITDDDYWADADEDAA